MKAAGAALRRDRAVVGLGLALITLIAWAYLMHMASAMTTTDVATGMGMTRLTTAAWDWRAAGLAALMWIAMLGAMMLPVAAPMILMFAKVRHRQQATGSAIAPTAVFVIGYVIVWGAFSVAAAAGQTALHRFAVLSSEMGRVDAWAGGTLLILAGAFQWSPLKAKCLEKCRSPLGFLLTEWREGWRGVLVMGMRHGAFCTGCCWALMLLMFVGGTMNLAWMAALAIYMLAEKVLPHGAAIGRAVGAAFCAAGLWMVIESSALA